MKYLFVPLCLAALLMNSAPSSAQAAGLTDNLRDLFSSLSSLQGKFAAIITSKPYIYIAPPTQATVWEQGKQYPVAWKAQNMATTSGRYTVALAKAANFQQVIAAIGTNLPATTTKIYWKVPQTVPAGNYKVTVAYTVGSTTLASAYSGTFAIKSPVPTITIIRPTANTVLPQGTSTPVQWSIASSSLLSSPGTTTVGYYREASGTTTVPSVTWFSGIPLAFTKTDWRTPTVAGTYRLVIRSKFGFSATSSVSHATSGPIIVK